MKKETYEAFQVFVNIVIVLFCLGAVPFAMTVTTRLAKIETNLSNMAVWRQDINELAKRVRTLEIKTGHHNHIK